MDILLRAMRYCVIMVDTKSLEERYLPLCQSVPQNELKRSSTRALNLGVTQSQKIGQTKATTDQTTDTSDEVLRPFMLKSGKMLMGLCQKVVISITKMATRLIMRWTICNVSHQKNIPNIMSSIIQKNAVSGLENTWMKYDHRRQHGIDRKKVEPFISSLAVWPTIRQNIKSIFATIAEKNFNRVIYNRDMPVFAPMLANPHGGVTLELTTKHACVSNAEVGLFATGMNLSHFVPEPAKRSHDFQTLLSSLGSARFAKEHSTYGKAASKFTAVSPARVRAALSKYFRIYIQAIGEIAPMAFYIGMDSDRYMVARFDLKPREVQYSRRVI